MSDIFVEPLVSVVIPTYGRADMLEKAILSVLEQTYDNIEIIIVNDNNIDSKYYELTNNVLKYYECNSKIKKVSIGTNIGGSLARNLGIEEAKGDYITFLDDDDFYYPDKIQKQLKHIIDNDLDVSVCDMDILKKGKILKKSKKGLARIGGINNFIINGNAYTPMIFLKKQVIVDVMGFTNIPRFQDHILMIKILEKGFRVGELRESLYVLNDHQGNRISYSAKSVQAYNIRNDFEKRNLNSLNKDELIKYKFNNCILKISIFSAIWNKSVLLKNILRSLYYSRSFSDILICFKCFIKILILKSR